MSLIDPQAEDHKKVDAEATKQSDNESGKEKLNDGTAEESPTKAPAKEEAELMTGLKKMANRLTELLEFLNPAARRTVLRAN